MDPRGTARLIGIRYRQRGNQRPGVEFAAHCADRALPLEPDGIVAEVAGTSSPLRVSNGLSPRIARSRFAAEENAIFPPNPKAIPGPVRYHRLARTSPRYTNWRPFWELVIAAVLYVTLQYLVVIASAIGAGMASPYSDEAEDFAEFLAAGALPESPLEWGFTMTALAVCFPAALLAVNIAGRRRLGSLFSVAGRFRWPLMFRAMAISLVAIGLAYALSNIFFDDVSITMDGAALAILALTLVLVPFQAAAEELLFRGVAAQAIGSWLRHPAFAFVIPTPIFVALHVYDYLGLVDVAVFALCAGFLAWATGGLEVPIGFHIANNWVAIGTAAFLGQNPAEPLITLPTTIFSVSTTLLITAYMYFDKQLTFQTTGTAEAIETLPPAAIVAGHADPPHFPGQPTPGQQWLPGAMPPSGPPPSSGKGLC